MFQSHDSKDDLPDGTVRILIVDDEPTLRLGFLYTLRDETTVVKTAENGCIAVEMASDERFDLMILDLRMPDMDGIEVLETLRRNGNQLPIILCSAGFTASAALGAICNGVVDFLLKPMRPSEIRDAVEAILNPTQSPLTCALQAIRDGNRGEAIRILENRTAPCPLEIHWLSALRTIRDAVPGTNAAIMEHRIGAPFSLLALNAPTTE